MPLRAGYNTGMSGATFKSQNQAPRVTPMAVDQGQPVTTLGVQNENATQNHPTFAQSNTSPAAPAASAEVNGFDVPLPAAPAAVEKVDVIQPGEYFPGLCEQMVQYFDRPKVKETVDTYTWKSGAVSEKKRHVPATPPHFSEFARKIGVTTRTLKIWAGKYPAFGEAYETCGEIYEEFLIENGLTGAYGAIAMKFVAVNKTKMKDKVVQENVALDINKVLDQIAAGQVKPGGQLDIPGDV